MSTPEEQFHHRLSAAERHVRRLRENPAPTVPRYNLTVPAGGSIARHAFNVTDGGLTTGNGKGMALPSPPYYIEIEYMLPWLTFFTIDNHAGYTGSLLVLANSNINSTGGPFDGIYIEAHLGTTGTFSSNLDPPQTWAYVSENSLNESLIASSPPFFDPSIIHTQRIFVDTGNFTTFRADGVDLWSYTLGFTPDRYYIGAIAGTGIGGNVGYYVASLKVGTTPSGSDIFSTDFSTMPTWDYSLSGAATTSFTQLDTTGHFSIP